MKLPDPFSRTFLPAAVAAQIPLATVNRHVNVLRRCAGNRDSVMVVAPCFKSNRPLGRGRPNNLLMVTQNRLVVTTETPVLRRLRLYLNAELHQLADVTWTAEPEHDAVQLALTAIDGVREHFWIRLANKAKMWQLDDALTLAFQRAADRGAPLKDKARKAAKTITLGLAA
jgi:hypothetical protein